MSARDKLLDEAEAELGRVEGRLAEGYYSSSHPANRSRRAPFITDVPGVGRVLVSEGGDMCGIRLGDEPALLIVDRGTEERAPLGLYFTLTAETARHIGAFCLDAAQRLDAGKGRQ
ncbi:MAG: hypothetical protein ACTHOJ_08445 [Sphingomonas oligoaromativorans]